VWQRIFLDGEDAQHVIVDRLRTSAPRGVSASGGRVRMRTA